MVHKNWNYCGIVEDISKNYKVMKEERKSPIVKFFQYVLIYDSWIKSDYIIVKVLKIQHMYHSRFYL